MIPDVQNELNRKVSETLQKLLQRNDVGLLDDDQLFVAVHALWDAVSGLVDSDLMDLMSRLMSNQSGVGSECCYIYSGNNRLIALLCRRMVDGTGEFEIRKLGTNGAKIERFETDTVSTGQMKMLDRCNSLRQQLEREGYQKLL